MILKRLLEVECEYKKSRSLNYRLRLAKLPTVKLLSETSQAKLVEHIDINEVIDTHNNIMLIGGAGSAKNSFSNRSGICCA
jgi:DNA replication protein DnaC